MKFSGLRLSHSHSRACFFLMLIFTISLLIISCGGGGSSNGSDQNPADNLDNSDDTIPQEQPKLGVTTNSINLNDCPDVKLYITVADEENQIIQNDPALSVKVLEDGVEQTENFSLTWMSDVKLPISVVFAMDYSNSMSDSALVAMENAVKSFINGMKSEDRAAIIKFYNQPQLMIGLTSDKAALIAAVDQPPASRDHTNIYDSVYDAVELVASSNETGRVAVILLTDGFHALLPEQTARYTLEEAIANAIEKQVPVFTIAYNLLVADEIKAIAEETGGLYFSTSNPDTLNDIYLSLFDFLNNQYEVSYTSSAADDLDHSILIEAEYNGIKGSSIIKNFKLCPAAP